MLETESKKMLKLFTGELNHILTWWILILLNLTLKKLLRLTLQTGIVVSALLGVQSYCISYMVLKVVLFYDLKGCET